MDNIYIMYQVRNNVSTAQGRWYVHVKVVCVSYSWAAGEGNMTHRQRLSAKVYSLIITANEPITLLESNLQYDNDNYELFKSRLI
jgi:hypothetical protein